MTVNANEPATKFFGPNHRFIKSTNPSRVIVQLHNLQPGEFWQPDLQPLIESRQTLIPFPGFELWFLSPFPFLWLWTYSPTGISLEVSHFVLSAPAFQINLNFAETRWMLNELTEPEGNYSFGGTATLTWTEI